MNKKQVIHLLAEKKVRLKRFKVRSLFVFGSLVRNELSPESDVDILVEFEKPVGLFEFLDLKEYLEDLLHRSVDLVPKDGIKKQLRKTILEEAERAA